MSRNLPKLTRIAIPRHFAFHHGHRNSTVGRPAMRPWSSINLFLGDFSATLVLPYHSTKETLTQALAQRAPVQLEAAAPRVVGQAQRVSITTENTLGTLFHGNEVIYTVEGLTFKTKLAKL